MKKNETALFCVTYPGCELFIQDFVHSINSQTYKDFDIVIVNDGFNVDLIPHLQYNITIFEGTGLISKNRELGINISRDLGYRYLILSDIDDYFHPDRVRKTIDGLIAYDCIVHDLDIVSIEGKLLQTEYFQKSHDIPDILPVNYLDEKNLCGFSNCGLKLYAIPPIQFPDELKIVDWYLFSNIINSSCKIGFLHESLTSYRQHSNNMIGIDNFTVDMFKKLLPLKIKHLDLMRRTNEKYNILYDKYKPMSLCSDKKIQQAISRNKKNINSPLWWENIIV